MEWGSKYNGLMQGGPQHYAFHTERFAAAFAPFGTRKILRMGGFSSEALTEVPPQETWNGLKALVTQAGFKVRCSSARPIELRHEAHADGCACECGGRCRGTDRHSALRDTDR